MSLFLLSFFIIYGAFHCYAYVKVRAALGIKGWLNIPAGLFMILMVSMPAATRLLEHAGFEASARTAAYLGYTWMGFLFFFVSTALVMDIIGIASILTQWLLRSAVRWPISKKTAFWLPAVIALTACLYGVFEAGNIRIETITVYTETMPPNRDRMRIVQISDLHLGLIVREKKLDQVVSKIKGTKPDILVSTGDLVDGQLAKLNGLTDIFQRVTPPLGKFAVTGNHEFYVGIEQSMDFIRRAGFQLLQGESVRIENWLTIAGLDDQVAVRMGLGNDKEYTLFDGISPDTFVVLLKHRPTVNPENIRHVNLQLSGHIHKGQIFPFNLLVGLVYPVPIGLSHPDEGSALYVSRGTGTWGPPFRVFSPPEITVIDLVKRKTSHNKFQK